MSRMHPLLLAMIPCVIGFARAGLAADAVAPPAVIAAPAAYTAEPGEPVDVDLAAVADVDALTLDVKALTSLPLVAAQARAAGVDAAEVADVIGAVIDVGASPAVATDLLLAETNQAKQRGGRPHFAGWVRGQLAAGQHSKQLVAMIEKREAEYIELSSGERGRLDAKLAAMRARSDRRAAASDAKTKQEIARALTRIEQVVAQVGRGLERASTPQARNEEHQR